MATVTTTFDIGDSVWIVVPQNLSVDNGSIASINILRRIESGNRTPTNTVVYSVDTADGQINSPQANTYATYETAVAALRLIIPPSPTPNRPTPTRSSTPVSLSLTPVASNTPSNTSTPVATRTPTRTPTRTRTPTPTPTKTRTPAVGASPTPTPSPSTNPVTPSTTP